MRISSQDYNDITVVELHGEFSGDFVDLFKHTTSDLVMKGKNGIVLDMSNTAGLDSAALEQILWLKDYCFDNTCILKLAALNETCKKILQMTRVEGQFDHYDELAGAVKSFT